MRYAVITRHRDEFPVRLMCRVLEVAPSGYYAARKRPPSWHALIDEVLMARVRIIHAESDESYGAPRVHMELQAEGLPASPKRVARLMREDGLAARPRRAYRVRTTDSNHDDPIAPNPPAATSKSPTRGRVKLPHLMRAGRGCGDVTWSVAASPLAPPPPSGASSCPQTSAGVRGGADGPVVG